MARLSAEKKQELLSRFIDELEKQEDQKSVLVALGLGSAQCTEKKFSELYWEAIKQKNGHLPFPSVWDAKSAHQYSVKKSLSLPKAELLAIGKTFDYPIPEGDLEVSFQGKTTLDGKTYLLVAIDSLSK